MSDDDAHDRGTSRRILTELERFKKPYAPGRSYPYRKRVEPVADQASAPPCNLPSTFKLSVEGGRAVKLDNQKQLLDSTRSEEETVLETVFARIDHNKDGRVDEADLTATLRVLRHRCPQKEIHDMLWEVDDDAVGFLGIDEFKRVYYRIRASYLREEPRDLFRLIEFMMIDQDASGTIDLDEAAQIFRARYGKAAVDGIQAIFEERSRARPALVDELEDERPTTSGSGRSSSRALVAARQAASRVGGSPLTPHEIQYLGSGVASSFVHMTYTEYLKSSEVLENAKRR